MNIVADKSIPFIGSYFNTIGKLNLLESHEITRGALSSADLLIVRSVTRVDRTLLEGTPVKFVATATSGHDHIDIRYLDDRAIGFAHARGCNARSVAEYVLSSLFVLAEQRQFDLSGKSIGIIGCGNVGSILRTFMDGLEVTCLVYDPPRQDSGDPDDFAGLDEVLQADIISLHVPLTDEGPYATRELVDSGFLSRLRTEVVFINTSRGDVVDEKALAGFIDTNPENSVVLDVWKNEPDINIGLLDKAAITTPHIAGYSLDARLNGTRMVYSKVCEAMNLQENGPDTSWLPEKGVISLDLSASEKDTDAIQMAVLASYDVRTDSAVLRQIEKVDKEQRGGYFSDLRKYYPVRREFPSMTVSLPEGYDRLEQKLKNLGFRIG